MGKPAYPQAQALLVMADGGGNNSSRARLWKVALQSPAAQALDACDDCAVWPEFACSVCRADEAVTAFRARVC